MGAQCDVLDDAGDVEGGLAVGGYLELEPEGKDVREDGDDEREEEAHRGQHDEARRDVAARLVLVLVAH